MEDLWDVKRVARHLGVTERTVYNKLRDGAIPALRVGGRWRFRPAEIEAWLDAARQGNGLSAEARGDTEAPTREDLERLLEGIEDPIERRLAFAGLLARACRGLGWREPVIVGGHAVEFYTAGGYTTLDIDLVAASDAIDEVLDPWGFARDGRHWYDEPLGLLVEAPGHQLDADQMSHVLLVEIHGERVAILGIEDLVVDRLNALVHWGSEEAGEWAGALLDGYRDRIDWDYLRARARAEDVADALSETAGES